MNTYGIDLMGRRRRRRHSAEFKAMVIGECMRPGVSMAAVALEHSLIANMLRKWVIDAEQAGPRAPMAPAVSQEVHTPALTDGHGHWCARRAGRSTQRCVHRRSCGHMLGCPHALRQCGLEATHTPACD